MSKFDTLIEKFTSSTIYKDSKMNDILTKLKNVETKLKKRGNLNIEKFLEFASSKGIDLTEDDLSYFFDNDARDIDKDGLNADYQWKHDVIIFY